jgi:glycosyltransferase involved in cell wall biosynthesis
MIIYERVGRLPDVLGAGRRHAMPAVSVIVPNYNHASFLRKRLDSILDQSYKDFEVILLDDCSTDNSRDILTAYADDSRVRIEFNAKNSGSTFKQWNKGVRLAKGKYVWIAESDDYADQRLLERLVAVLERDSAIAFAYCRSRAVTEDGQVMKGFVDSYLEELDGQRWKADYIGDGDEECRNYFVVWNTVPNASAVVFRKDIYDGVGGADETLRACGDWKVWSDMAHTRKVAYICEPLNYYRSHGATVRNKFMLHVPEILCFVRDLLERFKPQQNVLEQVCKMQAEGWVPAMMSARVPLRTKVAMLKTVKAIDPHPIRRVLRPALLTARLKIQRHWRATFGLS